MTNTTISPKKRVYIISSASVAGQKEKNGPLGRLFDISGDDRFGRDTWEKSESEMQRLALSLALGKAGIDKSEVDVLFAGDLINQCISSSFGLLSFDIPFLGLFGACSTAAEGMLMSTVFAGGVYSRCASVTSSHFCSAERQFRYPLEYGGQRPPTSQWTVTGSGAFVYSSLRSDVKNVKTDYIPEIVSVMPGRIVDRGITDANNMGAAMAPAAADTIERYMTTHSTDEYDLILTGDLGREGSAIFLDLLLSRGINIGKNHADCGMMIFSPDNSDTHAGGSGCGCSAVVMAANILPNIASGKLKKVLFMATGALMNTMSVNQGQTIPGIAHLVEIKAASRAEIMKSGEQQ